jgi:hypothetical protein
MGTSKSSEMILRTGVKKEPGLATGLFTEPEQLVALSSYQISGTYCTVKVMSSSTNEVCFEEFSLPVNLIVTFLPM